MSEEAYKTVFKLSSLAICTIIGYSIISDRTRSFIENSNSQLIETRELGGRPMDRFFEINGERFYSVKDGISLD